MTGRVLQFYAIRGVNYSDTLQRVERSGREGRGSFEGWTVLRKGTFVTGIVGMGHMPDVAASSTLDRETSAFDAQHHYQHRHH